MTSTSTLPHPLLLVLFSLFSLLASCATTPPPRSQHAPPVSTIALVGFHIVDVEAGRVVADQTVLITDDRITHVGPSSLVTPPEGARIIHGRGTFLAPGLVDAHVHLFGQAEAWLPLFLAHGVTTVFNLLGFDEHLELRDRVRAGSIIGPTIYTAGDHVTLPFVQTPSDAEAAVRQQHAHGFDFIKLYGDLSRDAFARAVQVGRELRMPVIGHAPRNLRYEAVLEEGMVWLAHAEEIAETGLPAGEVTSERIDSLAAQTAARRIFVTPTLENYTSIVEQWGDPTPIVRFSTERQHDWDLLDVRIQTWWLAGNPYTERTTDRSHIEERLQTITLLVQALGAHDVRLLIGTDTPVPTLMPGQSMHDEIARLHSLGLTSQALFKGATVNADLFLHEHGSSDERFGSIAIGRRADLLVLDENPLDDLAALRHPTLVIARGRIFSAEELAAMIDAWRAQNAASDIRPPAEWISNIHPTCHNPELGLQVRFFVHEGQLLAALVNAPGAIPLEPIAPRRFRGLGIPIDVDFTNPEICAHVRWPGRPEFDLTPM